MILIFFLSMNFIYIFKIHCKKVTKSIKAQKLDDDFFFLRNWLFNQQWILFGCLYVEQKNIYFTLNVICCMIKSVCTATFTDGGSGKTIRLALLYGKKKIHQSILQTQ